METILLLLGILLAGNQHSADAEYEFYRGVGIGCAGATLTVADANALKIPVEDVVVFCEGMVEAAQWRDLYGEQ